jgi:energy-coupling factor transporter ATP-binding protein EcfA2
MRGMDKAEIDEKVSRAAEILGLTPYLGRYPRALSGGQRQRVAMGRAIVRDPQVFLFDEPLSNLDAKLRVQMRSEIRELHQRLKTTTVYVTHDQIEAMTMADKIVVLQAGRIEQVGAPLDLYDRPENTFVAAFIGSPAMNLIDGRGPRRRGRGPGRCACRCRRDGGGRGPRGHLRHPPRTSGNRQRGDFRSRGGGGADGSETHSVVRAGEARGGGAVSRPRDLPPRRYAGAGARGGQGASFRQGVGCAALMPGRPPRGCPG